MRGTLLRGSTPLSSPLRGATLDSRPAVPRSTIAAHEVTLIRDADGLERLGEVWDTVGADRYRTPMQRHAWVAAAAEAFAHICAPRIFVLGPTDAPRAIAPLARRHGPGRPFELFGTAELFEPADFLCGDEEAPAELALALRSTGVPLRFERLLSDSPTAAALAAGTGAAIFPGAGVPAIDLGGGDPESALSGRLRQDLRRARRHAESIGAVEVELHAPTPQELGPLLEEVLRVEAAGWKRRARTALLYDPYRLRFFRAYARRAAAEGTLRIALLRIGGQAAAVQLASESDGRYWLFKIGYDETYARASPGQLLVLETLHAAAARGLASYEFLGGEETWISRWTTTVRPWCRVRSRPASVAFATVLARDGLRKIRKRFGRSGSGRLRMRLRERSG